MKKPLQPNMKSRSKKHLKNTLHDICKKRCIDKIFAVGFNPKNVAFYRCIFKTKNTNRPNNIKFFGNLSHPGKNGIGDRGKTIIKKFVISVAKCF
jgi:hypothetical protein